MIYIAYAFAWISTAIAVSVGIYYTHSIYCLWFMLIPAFMSVKTKEDSEKGDTDADSD